MGQVLTIPSKQSLKDHKKECTGLSYSSEKSSCEGDAVYYASQINPPRKVTSLVGRQCLVECYLNGLKIQALGDSGSQVCIVDERGKEEYLSTEKLKNVPELLDSPDSLTLIATCHISAGWKVLSGLLPKMTRQ